MSEAIRTRPSARWDLVDLAERIQQSSPDGAERFLDAVEETLQLVASMPEMGSPWESNHPDLAGLRFVRVNRFKNHLIFYVPHMEGLDVVRILYGTRDIEALLSGE
jgi:toxin ParE1/3/4